MCLEVQKLHFVQTKYVYGWRGRGGGEYILYKFTLMGCFPARV